MFRFYSATFFIILLLFVSGCVSSKPAVETKSAEEAEEPSKKETDDTPFKAYDKVITSNAVSDDGLFLLHQVKDDWFFEIPDSLLEREILWISRIAQTPANLSPFINGGTKVGEQVVRWQRKGNNILLRKISYTSVANDSLPVAQSVKVNTSSSRFPSRRFRRIRTAW